MNLKPILSLIEQGYVVVMAPLAAGPQSQPLNVNADTVAGEVARALNAEKLVLFTDVPGVLGADGRVVPELSRHQVEHMLDDGTKVRYEKSGKKQFLLHDTSSIPVYVLSELLKVAETEEG